MNQSRSFLAAVMAATLLISCNEQPKEEKETTTAAAVLKEENVSYTSDSLTMNGFIVYSDSLQGKRPAILVVHEWWGLNDYAKNRARQLARLGYTAMAVDMFGNGRTASNPDQALGYAMPYYKNPLLAKTRLDAALTKLKTYAQTDTSKIAIIGYCYGGFAALNAAKLGLDVDGTVVFHGNLNGEPPVKNAMKSEVLVCNGADDKFVSEQEISEFKKQMDSVDVSYVFKSYPNSVHAFTNPQSTENGKKFNIRIAYNPEADKNSWNDMRAFLSRIFSR